VHEVKHDGLRGRTTYPTPEDGAIGPRTCGTAQHATIVEMNVESYRRKVALKRKRSLGD
jgi:hypothetical protein